MARLLIAATIVSCLATDVQSIVFPDWSRYGYLGRPRPPLRPQASQRLEYCESGGLRFQGRCHYFSTEAVPWTEAERACRHYGTNVGLVTIINQDQQDWLTRQADRQEFWIGLAGKNNQSSWQWVDGTAPDYTNWNTQPQNFSGENCISMSSQTGLWRSGTCGLNKRYICSYPENQQIPCEGGLLFQDQCYWFSREKASWSMADKACRQYGTGIRLVTITNQDQQEWLSSTMRGKDLWIGLHELHEEGDWRWVDDTYPNYTNWALSRPTNASDTNCVAVSPSGDWYDRSCRSTKYYACSSANNSICHSGGIFFRDRCYWQSETAMKWTAAKAFCSNIEEGVGIVIIRDGELNEFLTRLVHNNIWIGLQDNLKENTWQWIDGSKPTFTNWAPGEPNDYDSGEDCSMLYGLTGWWNDASCTHPRLYAMCALPTHCVAMGPDGNERPCNSPYCSCVSTGSCVGTGQCKCVEIFPGMVCDKASVQVRLEAADQVDEGGSIQLKCHVNIPKVDYSFQLEHVRTRDPHSPQELPEERTRYYTTNDEKGYHEVVIYNATSQDTGSYVCVVSTTAGVVPVSRFGSAYVEVRSHLHGSTSGQLVNKNTRDEGVPGHQTIPVALLAVLLVLLLIALAAVLVQLRRKDRLPCNRVYMYKIGFRPNRLEIEEEANLHTL